LDLQQQERGKWKPEEDGKLAEAVQEHYNDWVAVARLVPCRTDGVVNDGFQFGSDRAVWWRKNTATTMTKLLSRYRHDQMARYEGLAFGYAHNAWSHHHFSWYNVFCFMVWVSSMFYRPDTAAFGLKPKKKKVSMY
jgi:hypothetical protein